MKLQKFKERALVMIGAEGFSDNLINFTVVQTFFIFATTLSDVFVSVFLYKSNGNDFLLVAKFQFFKYILEATAFTLALYITKWRNVLSSMKLGIICYIMAYVVLLTFQTSSRKIYVLVSLLVGFGSGFYWMGYHTLTRRYTTSENRQAAFGFISLISNAIATIAPPVSGLITKEMPGFGGYIIIFSITTATFIGTAFYSRKLTYETEEKIEIHLLQLIGQILQYSGTRKVMIGEVLRGIRDGVVLYYINVLVYYASSSEFIVGISLAAKNLLMILAYMYVKKLRTTAERCRTAVAVGVAELILLCIMLATGFTTGKVDGNLIMFYSIFYILFYVLAYNHGQLAVYDTMEYAGRIRNTDYEMVTIRHYAAETGRIIIISILIALPTNPVYGVILLIAGGITTIASAFVYKSGSDEMARIIKGEKS